MWGGLVSCTNWPALSPRSTAHMHVFEIIHCCSQPVRWVWYYEWVEDPKFPPSSHPPQQRSACISNSVNSAVSFDFKLARAKSCWQQLKVQIINRLSEHSQGKVRMCVCGNQRFVLGATVQPLMLHPAGLWQHNLQGVGKHTWTSISTVITTTQQMA